MTWAIHEWDVQRTPWPIESGSVQCVVTSPPYFGLRDYGVAGQLGLEPTFAEYVEKMVAVFREVRRVLRKDGTVWLNLGDCYAGSWGAQSRPNGNDVGSTLEGGSMLSERQIAEHPKTTHTGSTKRTGLKPKNLVGMPWRVAFALHADGWWLRSDIVWNKPNPMPESVTDRPTRAHEYVFLLTKAARYFYDQDAIREPMAESSIQRINQPTFDTQNGGPKDYGPESNRSARKALENLAERVGGGVWAERGQHSLGGVPGRQRDCTSSGANARTVWTIATQPYPEAHFATFPEELPRRCILAGTSKAGACEKCGAARGRVSERSGQPHAYQDRKYAGDDPRFATKRNLGARYQAQLDANPLVTTGWLANCSCGVSEVKPCLVLDPFAGSGTTILVADLLGRDAIGLELNPTYVEMARRRVAAPRSDAEAQRRGREESGQETLF